MELLSNVTSDVLGPDYRIHRYTDQIYKVVHFKSTAPRGVVLDRSKHEKYDKKLDQSLSRARRTVLELALCNDWKYFCTFTIAEKNYDRKDLVTWHKSFTQWLRDQRKKYNIDIQFLLVPELHSDGCSWHMHGLFSDIRPLLTSFYWLDKNGYDVPYYLVDDGFYTWVDYLLKFGFCSFGKIENKTAAAFYVTKYITKTLDDNCRSVGLHLYYPSRGLNRPTLHGEIYGHVAELDQYLVNHYDFCSTGMTSLKDNLDFTFGVEYMDISMLEAFKLPDQEEYIPEVDTFYDSVQLVLEGV